MLKKLLSAAVLLVCGAAWAGPNDVIVDRVWVGESIPGQTSATLELNITTIQPATLLSVSSPSAKAVEIQKLSLYRGKTTVRVVDRLALPAHHTTTFGSDRLFLMMTGLTQQLNAGDHVPVTLAVKYGNGRTQTITVDATVKKMELSYKHVGPGEVYDHR